MNDYRITDKLGEITVTAIDEKAARRTFKNFRKCSDAEIITVTLIRENTCATKAQEREALERIRAILAPLGPQSYCRTAFEGCLEDAENNIDDDAAYSMKARYEEAQNKLRQEIEEHQATRKELQRARQTFQEALNTVEQLRHKAAEAKASGITQADAVDITDAIGIINEKRSALEAEVENAAARIVEAAAEPESAAFKNAVSDHRAAKKELDYCAALTSRLAALRARWKQ